MKHKELITQKITQLTNLLSNQESSISRLDSPETLKNQLQVLRGKIEEIQILINVENSSFN